jgi:predicted negative regulator of RcsB-dependent stress response
MYKQCEVIERDLLREIKRLEHGFEKDNGYPEFGIVELTKLVIDNGRKDFAEELETKTAKRDVLAERLEFVRNLMIGKINVDAKTINQAYKALKK